jgi:hypothetical protein
MPMRGAWARGIRPNSERIYSCPLSLFTREDSKSNDDTVGTTTHAYFPVDSSEGYSARLLLGWAFPLAETGTLPITVRVRDEVGEHYLSEDQFLGMALYATSGEVSFFLADCRLSYTTKEVQQRYFPANGPVDVMQGFITLAGTQLPPGLSPNNWQRALLKNSYSTTRYVPTYLCSLDTSHSQSCTIVCPLAAG